MNLTPAGFSSVKLKSFSPFSSSSSSRTESRKVLLPDTKSISSEIIEKDFLAVLNKRTSKLMPKMGMHNDNFRLCSDLANVIFNEANAIKDPTARKIALETLKNIHEGTSSNRQLDVLQGRLFLSDALTRLDTAIQESEKSALKIKAMSLNDTYQQLLDTNSGDLSQYSRLNALKSKLEAYSNAERRGDIPAMTDALKFPDSVGQHGPLSRHIPNSVPVPPSRSVPPVDTNSAGGGGASRMPSPTVLPIVVSTTTSSVALPTEVPFPSPSSVSPDNSAGGGGVSSMPTTTSSVESPTGATPRSSTSSRPYFVRASERFTLVDPVDNPAGGGGASSMPTTEPVPLSRSVPPDHSAGGGGVSSMQTTTSSVLSPTEVPFPSPSSVSQIIRQTEVVHRQRRQQL